MTMHPDIHAMLASQRTGELLRNAYRPREERRRKRSWWRRRAARRAPGNAVTASTPQAAHAR